MAKGSQANSASSQGRSGGGGGGGKASSGGGGGGGGGKSSVSHNQSAKSNSISGGGGQSHISNSRSTFSSPNNPGYGQWTSGIARIVNEQVRSDGVRDTDYWALSQKTGITTRDLRDNVKSSSSTGTGKGANK